MQSYANNMTTKCNAPLCDNMMPCIPNTARNLALESRYLPFHLTNLAAILILTGSRWDEVMMQSYANNMTTKCNAPLCDNMMPCIPNTARNLALESRYLPFHLTNLAAILILTGSRWDEVMMQSYANNMTTKCNAPLCDNMMPCIPNTARNLALESRYLPFHLTNLAAILILTGSRWDEVMMQSYATNMTTKCNAPLCDNMMPCIPNTARNLALESRYLPFHLTNLAAILILTGSRWDEVMMQSYTNNMTTKCNAPLCDNMMPCIPNTARNLALESRYLPFHLTNLAAILILTGSRWNEVMMQSYANNMTTKCNAPLCDNMMPCIPNTARNLALESQYLPFHLTNLAAILILTGSRWDEVMMQSYANNMTTKCNAPLCDNMMPCIPNTARNLALESRYLPFHLTNLAAILILTGSRWDEVMMQSYANNMTTKCNAPLCDNMMPCIPNTARNLALESRYLPFHLTNLAAILILTGSRWDEVMMQSYATNMTTKCNAPLCDNMMPCIPNTARNLALESRYLPFHLTNLAAILILWTRVQTSGQYICAYVHLRIHIYI